MSKTVIIAIFISVILVIAGASLFFAKQNQGTPQDDISIQTKQAEINIFPTGIKENSAAVPLRTEEDIIRTFFALINEKRIPEAISMMTPGMVGDDSAKQTWGVQFDSLKSKSIVVKKIEPSMKEEWTPQKESYRVNINLEVSSGAANAPIPYYGWENGDNLRWMTFEKNENDIWKISSIATGP